MVLNILIVLSFIFTLIFKSKRYLHMLQQNLYNENNRYLKWVFKNIRLFWDVDIFIMAVALIGALVTYDLEKFSLLMGMTLIILNFILGLNYRKKINTDQNKKPLVITKRVRRLIITTTIIYFIPVILGILNIDNYQLVWWMMFMMSVMVFLNPFIVFLANIINHPYERGVYHYYKNKAQNKLKSMSGLKIIGITGSYGKTSSLRRTLYITCPNRNVLIINTNPNSFYFILQFIINLFRIITI